MKKTLKFEMCKKIIGLFWILLVPLQSPAAPLSLSAAMSEALSGSLEIQKSQSALAESNYKKTAAFGTYLPSLTGSINYLGQKKYMLLDVNFGNGATSIPQVVPTTIYTLKAQWLLFEGGAGALLHQAATANEESANQSLQWQKFLTVRQTILRYFNLLAQKALLEVAEQNKKALEDHLKEIKISQSVGASTNYDVLRVETQLSLAESELLSAIDNIEIAKIRLGEVLGHEKEERELTGRLPIFSKNFLEKIPKSEIQQRGDLQALKKMTEASDLSAAAARRYWVPRISVYGEFDKYNNINDRFSDNSAFREAYFAGINLTWNIFDGLQSYSRSGQLAEQAYQAEKNLRLLNLKAHQELEFWTRKFSYFNQMTLARESDIKRSEEAVRLAKAGRKAGVRTSSDLLDAEVDLFKSKAALVNAQLGAIEALTQIEIATGQELYNFLQEN